MSQRLRPLLKIPINLTYRLNLTWNCATNGKKASLAHIQDKDFKITFKPTFVCKQKNNLLILKTRLSRAAGHRILWYF